MNMIIYYTKSSVKQQLRNMKYVLLILMIIMPTMANADAIEGIYKTHPDSYFLSSGRKQQFGNSYEILIIANEDGSYYVDDFFGGWYSQRLGYGPDYSMSGIMDIQDDGTVSLKDSHVYGWNAGISSLNGTYDMVSSSFIINEEYDDITFLLTWIKVGEVFKKDGFIYKKEDENSVSVLKKDDSNIGNIVIPSEVSIDGKSYSVTSLNRAFYNCKDIEYVTIPNSMTSIDEYCFMHCTNLKSVTIPNSVTLIRKCAFYDCTGLTIMNLPESVKIIETSAFSECTSLATINIPNTVTEIGNQAFLGCLSLKSINIPQSLSTICSEVFANCTSLTSLIIPSNVSTIMGFTGCSGLSSIVVDPGNGIFDSRNNCNAVIDSNTNTLILGCKNTIIPNNVSSIGVAAFNGCSGLTTLNIPNSVNSIENGAFWGCSGLSSLFIPQSVSFIDSYSFSECTSLESILIPSSITYIGVNAFSNCTSLKDYYCYADNIPQTDLYAFGNYFNDIYYIKNATLHVPAASLDTYIQTEPWSDFGNIVALTDEDPKPTGIHTTSMNKDSKCDYYDLNGRNIIPIINGVYIQKGKKIIIKH